MSSPPKGQGATTGAAFASSPTILRRKKDGPGGAFGVATKAFDAIRDSVGAVGKMVVSSDSAVKTAGAATKTAPGAITADLQQQLPAHIADITHAFSTGLCHILAPLWSVGVDLLPTPASALPRLDYGSPAILNFAQQVIDQLPLDADIDIIAEHLSRDRAYATVFIVVMLAKVLLLERTFQRGSQTAVAVSEEDFTRSSTQDLLANLEQELRVKSSEPTKDTWPNDETSTSDMPARLLAEVGGAANKPRGPAELSPFLSHYRRRCLIRALQVSVCFPYYYCDVGVQYVCEAIAAQLFLVNFSEALVTLVSGRKGPCYVGKFIIHLAGTRPSFKDTVDALVPVSAQSTTLTQVNQLCGLSFDNFLHRNDIAETVLPAMVSAIQNSPTSYLGAVLRFCQMLLYEINCPDIGLLVELMDTARRHVTTPRPIGDSALGLVRAAWTSIRCVGCLQRDAMCRTFVAGAQMRSFRRRPIHLVTNVFSARSFVTTKMHRLPISVQRAMQNYRIPVSASGRVDPVSGQQLPQGEFSDDAIKYVSNMIVNVFQAAVELCETGLELADAKHAEEKNPAALGRTMGAESAEAAALASNQSSTAFGSANANNNAEDIKASLRLINAPQVRDNVLTIARTIVEHVDLRILYSVPPSIMVANVQRVIALFPKSIVAGEYSDPSKLRVFSDLSHVSAAVLSAVYELYLSIADYAKPVRGIAKAYRNENAMRPSRPLLTTVLSESEPVTESFREMCMALWKHCDARILDSEPASTHPQKDLALSQFVEDEMDIALMAGGGTLRRLATAIVSQKIEFPGTVPNPRFYVLPCGGDNDLASWIARCDSTYRVNVYGPVAIRQPTKASVKPDELAQPNELAQHPPPSFDALLLRRTLDFYTQNARYTNDVIVYQVECHCADGSKGVTMMCSNFEIGFHLNVAAVATQTATGKDSLMQPPTARGATGAANDRGSATSGPGSPGSPRGGRAGSSFSDTLSAGSGAAGGGDRASTSSGGGGILPSTFKPLPRYDGEGDPQPWTGMPHTKAAKEYLKTSCGQLFVQIGDVIESADWLMLQMHGPNGLKLQVRKNPSDSNSVVQNCATGSDVLDWLGSVYHAFDTRSAIQAAQHLLELGFLACVAVSPGRNPALFHEVCLYVPKARHGSDYPTPPIPTNKSRPYGIAQGVKDVLSSLSHAEAVAAAENSKTEKEPGTGGKRYEIPKPIPQLNCTVRVGFTHRPEDAHYYELSPPSDETLGIAAAAAGGTGAMAAAHGSGGGPEEDAKPAGPADIVRPRDVVFIKVRSCGSAGDSGPAADPCSCALEMSICETATAGRKDSVLPRDALNSNDEPIVPPLEQRHFTLHFGARDSHTGKIEIDPKCELSIDTAIPAPEDRTSPLARDAGGPANLFCSIDGDVLGPFCAFRIRPVLIDPVKKLPATLSVASFTPLSSDL